MTLKSIFAILTVILVLASCNSNPLDVDVSKTQVNIGFVNLDSNLVNTRSANRIVMHHKFMDEISEIYEYNLGYCIRMSNASDSSFVVSLTNFLADPYIKRLEKRIGEKFPDLSAYKMELIDGFKHLKHHIPTGKMPENIVFMNSLFNANAFSTEKQIGLGLDNYLGASTDVVKELPNEPFYEWIKEAMDEKFMTRDALCSWIMTHYVDEVDGNLAEHIIRWGKVLYLTQAAFPNKEPELILRYSTVDYKWALENEYALWKYLVDEKMLFTLNELNTRNLLKEGPFTAGLPEKGPDRLGQFLGYRMILKYMEAKEITVEELIKTPYTDILVEYEID